MADRCRNTSHSQCWRHGSIRWNPVSIAGATSADSREESRKAWLFRVAYNEAMLFRRRQAVGDKANRNLGWTRKNESEPADEPLLRMEAVERVRVAVAQLPVDQQQIVKMRIYEEKTFAVIAKELNIPLGTALGRMRLATIKLRAALEQSDAEED